MRRGLTLPRRFRSTPKQAPFSGKEKNSELGIQAIVCKVKEKRVTQPNFQHGYAIFCPYGQL